MGLTDLINDVKPKPLKSYIDLFIKELGNVEQDVRAAGFHVSQLYYLCPRKIIFDAMNELPLEAVKPPAGLRITFDIGTAVHEWFQDRYLGPMGLLWGDWRCKVCKHVVKESYMPGSCEACGASQRKIGYKELGVRDPEHNLVGHADGILMPPGEAPRLLEMKTINTTGWGKLQHPYQAHVWQATAYMKLLDLSAVEFWYIDKGRQFDTYKGKDRTRIKAFVVPFDPVIWEKIKDKLLLAMSLQEDIKNGVSFTEERAVGIKRVCWNKSCFIAKDCPFAKQCFSVDE